MHVLLLSGTGWVGSHIVQELLAHGYEVTVMARGTTHGDFDHTMVEMVPCDRENLPELKEKLQTYAKDIVIDVIPGRYGGENTAFVADCLTGRISRYLHCSSTGVFTPLPAIPGRETDPITTTKETFGGGWLGKADADRAILARIQKGFPGTILHPSIIMGPGAYPLDNLGNRDTRFIQNIRTGAPVYLPDAGGNLMQMVHVKDLARAFRLAIEHKESIGQNIIISGDRAITSRQYVALAASILGCKANIRFAPAAELLARNDLDLSPTDFKFFLEHMSFDLSKAKNTIGYEPSYTVEALLRESIGWTLEQYAQNGIPE